MSEVVALCLLAFLAGLVDAVAGGGGLIQLPALFAFFPTLPPPLLIGTNKLSAIGGTLIATVRYGWSVPIQWRAVLPAASVAGISALAGASSVTRMDPVILKPVVLLLLIVVAAYTLLRPKLGNEPGATPIWRPGSLGFYVMAAVLGFYDGFLGPGAGSLMMFALVRLFGFDFLTAAANTKVLNLASNFGSLVLFMATGNVLYAVALPMALCNIAGGFLGAHLAVRGGSRLIRPVFLAVVMALIVKVLVDLLRSL